MKKYTIVMFNMSRYVDWEESGVVNRNFHILHNLAKDERVENILAIDFLPFNWKRALKNFIHEFIVHSRRGETIFGNLTTQVWKVSSKIFVMNTIDSMLNPKRIMENVKKVLELIGGNNEKIVWSYNPMFVDYFDKLENAIYVFDAVDNWLHHSSYQKYYNQLYSNYELIKLKSDLIFTVSNEMRDFMGPKAFWAPNAVDPDHFNQNTVNSEVRHLNKPVIGFLGILQDRIDTDILTNLARNFPNGSIVLAGPVWKNFNKEPLLKFKNVIFTGPVGYNEIPSFYNGFDIGIIPYKQNAFVQSTNSMKFYEYLSAGLPIVSTMTGGANDFGKFVSIAHTPESFYENVKTELEQNSSELKQQRIEFVKKFSWKNRVNEMMKHIEAQS